MAQVKHSSSADAVQERRVRIWLDQQHTRALRQLDVRVIGQTVIIGGCVSTFYEKQLATSCCQRVAGILHVHNQIEVKEDDPADTAPEAGARPPKAC